MASKIPPKRGVAYAFETSLTSQADVKLFQDNPTLAAGDVVVIKDGSLDGNIDTLPTAIVGATRSILVTLSATEMTADRVTVLFHDQAGAEWCDLSLTLETAAQQFDDLAATADLAGLISFPAGAITYEYIVTDLVSGLPIADVQIWISTDLAGSNVIWSGYTDAFGVARDVNGNKPMLDAGTYYVWKQKTGKIDDDNPDTEIVS